MKKVLLVILCISVSLIFISCSKINANEVDKNTTKNLNNIISSDIVKSDDKQKDNKSDNSNFRLNSNIEQIYVTVLDATFKVDASEEILTALELSKSASEPVLDEKTMINAGTIKIEYKNNDTLEEFGEAYITDNMDLYIKSNENKNNAIVKIDFDLSQNSSDDSESNMERFEPFYKSLFN